MILVSSILLLWCCAMATPATTTPSDGDALLPTWSECGVSSAATRAVSEDDATDAVPAFLGQFPWTARVYFTTSERRHLCLGSLISHRYVLTAASCVQPALEGHVKKPFGGMTVRMGEHDLTSDPDCDAVVCAPRPHEIRVQNVTSHPDYRPFLHNDAALLRLAKPLNYSDYVRPVCLPMSEGEEGTQWSPESALDSLPLVLAGWNLRAPPASGTSLASVRLPLLEGEACRRLYAHALGLGQALGLDDARATPAAVLCAGAGHASDARTSCFAGPGAALTLPFRHDAPDASPTIKYVQVAMTNSGLTCARRGLPGVFTRVDALLPWILQSMQPS